MDELVKALLSAKNKEEMENLVSGLFSPNEQVEFNTRIKFYRCLKKEWHSIRLLKNLVLE